jgi:hypothetical protein
MGNSYYKTLTFFDDGEPFINTGCIAASLNQVQQIVNSLGQRTDDRPNDLSGTVTNAFPIDGIIETRNDIDAFAVPAGTISVQPYTNSNGENPNLHLTVNYYNSSKVLVSTNTSESALGVSVVSAGGYITVTTRANGNHSTYGMLGKYRVTTTALLPFYPKIHKW